MSCATVAIFCYIWIYVDICGTLSPVIALCNIIKGGVL